MKLRSACWDGDFANIRYQAASKKQSDSLSVKQTAFWSYCGPALGPHASALPASFREWAAHSLSGDLLPRLLPFLRGVNELLAERGVSSYWLTIRATSPTEEFNTPRWHTDALFFADKNNDAAARKTATSLGTETTDWKISATLLGSPTLFIPKEHQNTARRRQMTSKKAHQTDHPCNSIRCVGCATSADAVRQDLARSLASCGTHQARKGEFSLFRTGHSQGAVHSEPAMSHADRIFCNVVPGTEEELKTLVLQWGMEFPRSWWIASHVSQRPGASK